MKYIRIFLAMALMIGFPCPIISAEYLQMEHSVLFAPLSILSAFIGTGLIFGFKTFKQRPMHIGNVADDTMPIINQTWAVFFISAICNLLMANLTGV
jgi:hypothetical protein